MRLGVFAIVVGLTGCVLGPAHSDGAIPQKQLQAVIDNYLAARGTVEKISGIALHVEIKGQGPIDVYTGTYGRSAHAIDNQTLFQIGSNTKHFTAALVLKLEAEGKLNIDQTVGEWLPQYPAWAKITIRSLLNMTSNIPNYSETVSFVRTAAADINHQFSYDDLISAAYDKNLPVPDGYFYSNTNSILAAKIIEAAAHMSYADALDQMLKPLRLGSTFYSNGPYPQHVLNRLPAGIYDNTDCPLYQPKPCTTTAWAPLLGQDVSRANMSWAGPAGGIISNTRDLSTWVSALFKGRVLPSKQLNEMTSITSVKTGKAISDVSAEDPAGFGLDLGRGYQPAMGKYWFYQGTTLGFRTIFAYWPRHDLIITTSTNSQPEDGEDKLAATVIGEAFEILKKAGLTPDRR